jgi:hypothetical protein
MVFAAVVAVAPRASATHSRYGRVTWLPRTGVDLDAVVFTVQNVWRRAAYDTADGRCVDAATHGSTTRTGLGGFVDVGDRIREQQGGRRHRHRLCHKVRESQCEPRFVTVIEQFGEP